MTFAGNEAAIAKHKINNISPFMLLIIINKTY